MKKKVETIKKTESRLFIYVRPFDHSSGLLRLKYSVFRERPISM